MANSNFKRINLTYVGEIYSMDVKNLLPIGSVVLLKEGKKRLMIYGVKQTDQTTNKEYDYIGVLYPEGNIGSVGHFFFNHSDIEVISYLGLNDMERQKFLEKLSAFYTKQTQENV